MAKGKVDRLVHAIVAAAMELGERSEARADTGRILASVVEYKRGDNKFYPAA